MSSTDKQGSSLGSLPTSHPLYPHFNWPSGFWPCVKSCLVGGSDKYQDTRWEGSYPSGEKQSVYSTAPADWATRTLVGRGLTPLERSSQCILQPQPTGPPGHSLGGVLPLWREAVSVFYSPSRLGHQDTRWEESYPSGEKQSVYSTAPADWATRTLVGRGLTPLERSSQCILQPQPTGPPGHSLGGVLPIWREAVSVFYSPSRLGLQHSLIGSMHSTQRKYLVSGESWKS